MPRKTAETRLKAVKPVGDLRVEITWNNDFTDTVDVSEPMRHRVFDAWRELDAFQTVHLDDMKYEIRWSDEAAIPIHQLRELIAAQSSARFRAWLERSGMTYDQAAVALGLARRTVANYANGERVPRHVALACAAIEAGVAA
jgi:DNA-binding XRE family transcriptional regulator